MKRVGHLIDRIADPENLRIAFLKARRGKGSSHVVQTFQKSLHLNLARLREGILRGSVPVGEHRHFKIYEPKERLISAAAFPERVLHHAIFNVCDTYFESALIPNTYACRKGKGVSKALLQARQYTSRFRYCLRMDVRNYFDTINHQKLLSLLHTKFKDRKLLELWRRIIQSHSSSPNSGLPIGNLSSQYFANFYLNPLDRLLSGPRGEVGYLRYMDDILVYSNSRRELGAARKSTKRLLEETLGLRLKHAILTSTGNGVPYLGRIVTRSAVKLDRRRRQRYARNILNVDRQFERHSLSEGEAQAKATAITGTIRSASSRSLRLSVLRSIQFGHDPMERSAATTACCEAAAGTTMRPTCGALTATTTAPPTATTTTVSACSAARRDARCGKETRNRDQTRMSGDNSLQNETAIASTLLVAPEKAPNPESKNPFTKK